MKFEKLTQTFKTNGSHFQGDIEITWDEIVAVIGNPCHDGDGYKVDAEWVLEFEDGCIATLYNWKDGKNYCGDQGYDVKEIRHWHIGGFSQDAVDKVHVLFGNRADFVCWKNNHRSYKEVA